MAHPSATQLRAYALSARQAPTTLLGLGDLAADVDGLLLRAPSPSAIELAGFLRLYAEGEPRNAAARALIAKGVSPANIADALSAVRISSSIKWGRVWGVLALASSAAGAYHGYRRNQSIGWALWWSIAGGIFPVFTPALALAQGFGKRKGS